MISKFKIWQNLEECKSIELHLITQNPKKSRSSLSLHKFKISKKDFRQQLEEYLSFREPTQYEGGNPDNLPFHCFLDNDGKLIIVADSRPHREGARMHRHHLWKKFEQQLSLTHYQKISPSPYGEETVIIHLNVQNQFEVHLRKNSEHNLLVIESFDIDSNRRTFGELDVGLGELKISSINDHYVHLCVGSDNKKLTLVGSTYDVENENGLMEAGIPSMDIQIEDVTSKIEKCFLITAVSNRIYDITEGFVKVKRAPVEVHDL